MTQNTSRTGLLFALVVVTALAHVAQEAAYCQARGATAKLVGQVTDESGAVSRRVELTLINEDTNVSARGQSNAVGYYRFFPTAGNLHANCSTAWILDQQHREHRPPSKTVLASTVVLSTQTSELGEVVAETPVKLLSLLMRDPSSPVNLVAGVLTRQISIAGLSF